MDRLSAFDRGLAAEGRGALREAEACYRAGAADPRARAALGALLARTGRAAEAEALLRALLAEQPSAPFPHHTLGALLLREGRAGEALAVLERAVALEPALAVAHTNLGVAFRALGRMREAEAAWQAALARDPRSLQAARNLAGLLLEQGALERAAAAYGAVLAAHPADEEALVGHAFVLKALGRLGEAADTLRRAVALVPASARARFHLANLLLLQGRYAEAWPHFEARRAVALARAGGGTITVDAARPADLAERTWGGEPDPAIRVVAWHEQGFGDTLQFCRYAPLAAARVRTILAVPPPLHRLLATLGGEIELAPLDALPSHDAAVPMMSLPGLFGTTPDSIPGAGGYLRADPEAAVGWRARLAGTPGLRVGLCWAGESRADFPQAQAIDRRRSIRLAQLRPLAEAAPGARFFSLQLGAPAAEIGTAGFPVADHTAAFGDFADTASFMAALDLVVAVDTAVAHLAGALGVPVFMLNRFDTDWRWGLEGERTPWYASMRLLRQPAPGDWETPIARLAERLARVGALPERSGSGVVLPLM